MSSGRSMKPKTSLLQRIGPRGINLGMAFMASDSIRVSGWLDSNVILRFILADDMIQSERAAALVRRAEAGELSLTIATTVLCEVVWVLERLGYARDRICNALIRFCLLEGIRPDHPDLALSALLRYRDRNVDFADAVLDVTAARYGATVWTFDKHDFGRMSSNWAEPG